MFSIECLLECSLGGAIFVQVGCDLSQQNDSIWGNSAETPRARWNSPPSPYEVTDIDMDHGTLMLTCLFRMVGSETHELFELLFTLVIPEESLVSYLHLIKTHPPTYSVHAKFYQKLEARCRPCPCNPSRHRYCLSLLYMYCITSRYDSIRKYPEAERARVI